MKLIDVYLEDPFLHNEPLTYHYQHDIPVGCRVLVAVQTTERIGFVARCYEGETTFETREILSVIDDKPIVSKELWKLGHWMAETTLNPIIRCFQAILPNQLKPTSSFLKKQYVTKYKTIDISKINTDRQFEVFHQIDGMTMTEANKAFKTIPRALERLGAIERYQELKQYQPQQIQVSNSPLVLNDAQKRVLGEINLSKHHTYLLFGVTGSGKTEVYLQAGAQVLKEKKQVLILVPEISLTPQMIDRFQQRFGQDIGIYHSGLNPQEKYEQYLRVQKDEVSIVVGTRSAVFLPFHNLGLIVVDEEHDTSYKQDTSPYYHARDIAIWRAQYHHCPIILGSASPSLQSYARGYKGNYKLLELNHRINHNLPDVKVIDTHQQLRQLSYQPIAKPLLDALKTRLNKGEQSILLLNRRSYSPIMKCENCGKVLMCPHCDTALSYHKSDESLRCHTCDFVSHQFGCPSCGHKTYDMKGLGTQRLEEIIQKLLPSARILRMDRDTTTRKNSHMTMLKGFSDHEYDILIGTQMIAKGLDIPNVTCVGIINPDSALMHEDFSSAQHAFSLILQASGRAGRHDLAGEVYIQTDHPNHYAIKLAIKQDYKQFFNYEMRYRHMGNYPPYSYLIELIFSHRDQERLFEICGQFQTTLLMETSIVTLGPALMRKVSQIERMRIVVKGKNLDEMRTIVSHVYDQYHKKLKGVSVSMNVNPMSLSS